MQSLYDQIGPLMMVLARVGGVFVVAPLLASTGIPLMARSLLAFSLALAMYPLLPVHAAAGPAPDLLTLSALIFGEATVGFFIGLLALLPIIAVQLAGMLMGLQMGFGLATVYNPALEAESDIFGELLLYLALGVFIALGGVEAMFETVARSFQTLPLGSIGAGESPARAVTAAMHAGFELAVRVSLPLLAIITIETVASAFLMKTMPQLNIMSLGFASKIILGLLAIVLGLGAMHEAIGDGVLAGLRGMMRLVDGGKSGLGW